MLVSIILLWVSNKRGWMSVDWLSYVTFWWEFLVYAASWAISVYYAYQRTWKPFNPILGETYEMVNHGGITFISEQVRMSNLLLFHFAYVPMYSFSFLNSEVNQGLLCSLKQGSTGHRSCENNLHMCSLEALVACALFLFPKSIVSQLYCYRFVIILQWVLDMLKMSILHMMWRQS